VINVGKIRFSGSVSGKEFSIVEEVSGSVPDKDEKHTFKVTPHGIKEQFNLE